MAETTFWAAFDWDALFPIIALILWIISKALTGDGEKSAPAGKNEPDPEQARRAQELRDEIRRRIAERSREGADEPATRTLAPPPPQQQRRDRDEPEVVFEEDDERSGSDGDYGYDYGADRAFGQEGIPFDYEARLKEEQARMAETQAEQDRVLAGLRAARNNREKGEVNRSWEIEKEVHLLSSQDLRRVLRSRREARKAIIYREVLGPPKALAREREESPAGV